MKTRNQWRGITFVAVVMALCTFAISAQSAVLIDELFESGYNRTSNDIAGGNMAWFKGRSGAVATVNVGSLSFSASGNLGADGQWGYFTDAGATFAIGGTAGSIVSDGHVLLGVGDVLKASVGIYLPTMPANTADASLRFGLFDGPNGRSANDFNGGPSSSMFTNNPGFATFYSLMSIATNNGMSVTSHTVLTSANIFSSSSNFQTIDGGGGGLMPGMLSMTNYTLSFSVARPDASTWELTTSVNDTLTGNPIESYTISTNSGVSTFNWMLLRWNSTIPTFDYTELKVSVDQIVPEPSTLLLAGFGLAFAAFSIRRRRS